MKKSLLTAAFVFALAAPALAAGQFYVALDTSTRECHVMDTRPDGTTQKMVGSGAYKTEAEAEQALQSLTDADARHEPSVWSKKPPQSTADRDVLKGFEAVPRYLLKSIRLVQATGECAR